jgi:hypothetical protein
MQFLPEGHLDVAIYDANALLPALARTVQLDRVCARRQRAERQATGWFDDAV